MWLTCEKWVSLHWVCLCACIHLGEHTRLSCPVAQDCPGFCKPLLRLPNVCGSSAGTIVCVWHVAEPMLRFACGCRTQRLVTHSKQATYPLAQRGLLPQITASRRLPPLKLCGHVCVHVCVLAMVVSWFGFSEPIFYKCAFRTTEIVIRWCMFEFKVNSPS